MHDHYDPRARFWMVLSLCALLVLGALQAARAQPPGVTAGGSTAAPASQQATGAPPAPGDARHRLSAAHG